MESACVLSFSLSFQRLSSFPSISLAARGHPYQRGRQVLLGPLPLASLHSTTGWRFRRRSGYLHVVFVCVCTICRCELVLVDTLCTTDCPNVLSLHGLLFYCSSRCVVLVVWTAFLLDFIFQTSPDFPCLVSYVPGGILRSFVCAVTSLHSYSCLTGGFYWSLLLSCG